VWTTAAASLADTFSAIGHETTIHRSGPGRVDVLSFRASCWGQSIAASATLTSADLRMSDMAAEAEDNGSFTP
jgi:hypothetical protein